MPVCYFYNHFVISSLDNQHFIGEHRLLDKSMYLKKIFFLISQLKQYVVGSLNEMVLLSTKQQMLKMMGKTISTIYALNIWLSGPIE